MKKLVDYLAEIKKYQEEKMFCSSNINSLKSMIDGLGIKNTYEFPHFWTKKLIITRTPLLIVSISFALIIFLKAGKNSDYLNIAKKILVLFVLFIVLDAIIVVIQNRAIYTKELENYYKLRKQDDERVDFEIHVKKKELEIQLSDNQKKINLIDKKLDSLYSEENIPMKYRNYQCAVMFHDYVSNLRCLNIRECIRVFELDMKYFDVKERISLLDCKIEDLKSSLSKELVCLRNSVDRVVNRSQEYIEYSINNTEERINEINRNMFLEQLYINDLYNKKDED